ILSLLSPRFADVELAITHKARTSAIHSFIRFIVTFRRNPQPNCCRCTLNSKMSVPFANLTKGAHDRSMTAESLSRAFAQLSTPLIADAALRLEIPFRISPPGIRPVTANQRLAGPALPARHFGSVDVFLEAMQDAKPGDVLVIDNGGRLDEGCIGDLTSLEAETAVSLESLCGARMRHTRAAADSSTNFQLRDVAVRPATARHPRFVG